MSSKRARGKKRDAADVELDDNDQKDGPSPESRHSADIGSMQIQIGLDGVERGPISESAIDSQSAEWQSKLQQFLASREQRRVLFNNVVDKTWDARGRVRFATIPLCFLPKSVAFSDIFVFGERQDVLLYLSDECRLQFMDSVQMTVVDRTVAEEEFTATFDVIVSPYLRGVKWRGLGAVDPTVLKHCSLMEGARHAGDRTTDAPLMSSSSSFDSSSSSSSSSSLLSSPPLSCTSGPSTTPATSAQSISLFSPVYSKQLPLATTECEALVSSGLALEYAGKYDEALSVWLRLYAARHHYGFFKIGVRYLRGWRMPLSLETAIYLFEQAIVANASGGPVPSQMITPALPYVLSVYERVGSPGTTIAGKGHMLWLNGASFGEWLRRYWTARWLSRLLPAEESGEPPAPWSVRVYREAGARFSAQQPKGYADEVDLAEFYQKEAFDVPVIGPFVDMDLLWMRAVDMECPDRPPVPLLERRYPPALYAAANTHMPLYGTCDLPRAAELFEEAAAAGVADACYRLGYMYATGHGISPSKDDQEMRRKGHDAKNHFTLDKAKAVELLTCAANALQPEAEQLLIALRVQDETRSKNPAKLV